ncbi:Uncharacterized conserved protein YdeI, YjbR/CyaY-like superfamily, DUF1801 family [Maribacter dokdonensis]|uniref:Uncharacterized conserved protein YdeI, YjbR/CyaY-like superfamily, DUF1801 family n=1 Tax=Maribacter dokdonensis TaxID=320912 RepID=A0A1H4M4N3_9FLAO|nr:DUF1801 domain-containing protein [Maribacter dokdonensis]SEB77767.1 Uncharacterized conserved protein YdeI, YjbR/CyaY-like superfamily, DUF1801 family [Maribacter dokdonensis]
MNLKVDDFLNEQVVWKNELSLLREIILECDVKEDFKWKHPCYTKNGKNIVLIHGFKQYCALLFYKGALLRDPHYILIQQTENVQAGRQIRFKNTEDILKMKKVIKDYIFEAVEIEKSNLIIPTKKVSDYEVPEELKIIFKENPTFKNAFEKLTPGRQKGYLLHFSKAKQSSTRLARINKYTNRILSGKGLNDCVCGLSKRMPNCDGSHKGTGTIS